NRIAQTTNTGAFTLNWSTNAVGWYTFTAVATDNDGLTNDLSSATARITIAVTNASPGTITASIDNLANDITSSFGGFSVTNLPIIRDGFFDLLGKARDSITNEPLAYQLLLFRPEDEDSTIGDDPFVTIQSASPFKNVTPGPLDLASFHKGGDVTNYL